MGLYHYSNMMFQTLNERYGLGKNVLLEYIGEGHIAIMKFVKRRLLVKDGELFIDIAKKIKEKDPDMKVSLLCSDNICSRTVAMLEKAGIDVLIGGEEEEI